MIAVLAPYGRNEVTAAAIRLADLVVSVGEEARLISLGVHEAQVHPFWDGRVRSGKGDNLYAAARGAEYCVWFGGGATAYRRGSLVANKKAMHLGVAQWHALRPCDKETMALYDRVYCPNRHAADLITQAFYAGIASPPPEVFACSWSAGLSHTPHSGLVASRPRVAVACDATSVDDCGQALLSVVFEILREEDCELTLVCAKSWSRRERARLHELTGLFPHRFSCCYPTSFVEQAAAFQSHDLLLLPSLKSDFGLTAARGLACGLPIVCHDISPLSDHVLWDRNGVLVPCLLKENWLKAPVAVINGPALARGVLDLLHDRSRLFRLQRNEWYIPALTNSFETFWQEQLGLT